MDLTNPNDLKLAMRLAGITPHKGLGQHFLVDSASLDQIVAAGEVNVDDTVLEIGPGLGVMTSRLTELAGHVIAVEADRVLAELLSRDAPANLKVESDDILNFDFRQLPADYKVIANIPYYLTAKIFRLLLENPNPPKLVVVLIQREVADRIVAKPGQLSVLALSVQYYTATELVGAVERHKFWPPPQVDSAILRLRRRSQPAFSADSQKLFRLIKAGFGEKRKQLRNSLAGGLNCTIEVSTKLLAAAKLPDTARAQELSLSDWQKLYSQAIKAGLLS